MKSHLSERLAAAALVAGALLLTMWGVPRAASPEPSLRQAPAPIPTLEGSLSGMVQLDWVLVGALSDTLHTPTSTPTLGPKIPPPAATPRPRPNLGRMDLGVLVRSQPRPSGNYSVTGYVDLAASQVFTRTYDIMATPASLKPRAPKAPAPAAVKLAVGPYVSGVLTVTNGITLDLRSEKFPMKTSSGLSLQRQFRLLGKKVEGNGGMFEVQSDESPQPAEAIPCRDKNGKPALCTPTPTPSPTPSPLPPEGGWISDVYEGEYRETFWNLSAMPVTLVGRFRLVQPVFVNPTPTPTKTGGKK